MKVNLEQEFADNTTLHGIGRVIQAGSLLVRVLWSLVFLTAFGLFIWMFTERVQAFYKYEVTTIVKVDHLPRLPYPAVTICNFNRFMSNRIKDQDRDKVGKVLNIIESTSRMFFNDYDGTDDTDFDTVDKINEEDSYTSAEDHFDFKDFSRKSGFNLNESLRRCDWKGIKYSCDSSNFKGTYLPDYGMCYTFNLDYKIILNQTYPGSGNGLRIWVDIGQEHYMESYKDGHHEAGLKFIVHNQNDPPMIDTRGMAASPGFHTYVAVRLSQFNGLPKPYTDCVTKKPPYSRVSCLDNCKRDFIITECQCKPIGTRYRGTMRVCSPDETAYCVGKAVQKFSSSKTAVSDCIAVCPHLCNQTTYESSMSMAVYPSEKLLSDMSKDPERFEEILGTPRNVTTDSDDNLYREAISEHLRKNWVLLDIYYDQLTVTSYNHVPSITWPALLSDLGGQMGLFVGCSVITMAEILEYLIRKIYRLFKRSSNQVMALDEDDK